MAVSDYDLIQAWKQVLTLSKLERGQIVTVLTSASTHPQTLACALLAATDLGAIVNRLDLPPVNGEKAMSRDSLAYLGTTPLTGNHAAIAALKASDLVLDLMTLLFSPEQHEILASGTKILLAVEPPEVLARMVPTLDDKKRVMAAAEKIGKAKEMHVTSDAGTDVRFALGQFPAISEYGFVDEPGRWDHWPSGFALTWANEGEAKGTIVLARGDILLPMKSYVQDRVHFKIEKGFCTAIEGGVRCGDSLGIHGHLQRSGCLRDVAHWLGPAAARPLVYLAMYDREATIGMDARAFEGNFLFSFGPNNEVGGSRTTACHIDIPMRNCTVALDGVEVVRRGQVLDGYGPKPGLKPGARRA